MPYSRQATIEWESQDDGFIAQILVPEGTSGISVGTPVLVITESKEDVPAFAAFTAADAGAAGAPAKAAAPKAEAAAPAAQAAAAPAAPAAAAPAAAPQPAVHAAAPGGRVIASPYARRLAAEAGVSLAGAPGSGPGGRIVAADVQQLIASGGAAPAAAVGGAAPEAAYAYAAYTDIPNSQIRKVGGCLVCCRGWRVPAVPKCGKGLDSVNAPGLPPFAALPANCAALPGSSLLHTTPHAPAHPPTRSHNLPPGHRAPAAGEQAAGASLLPHRLRARRPPAAAQVRFGAPDFAGAAWFKVSTVGLAILSPWRWHVPLFLGCLQAGAGCRIAGKPTSAMLILDRPAQCFCSPPRPAGSS